jgi:pyrimidine-nucleoside phosphorylase
MNSEEIGLVSVMLGAGRATKTDTIDPLAGIEIFKKTGDKVQKGDPLCILYTERKAVLEQAAKRYLSALMFQGEKPALPPLILQ